MSVALDSVVRWSLRVRPQSFALLCFRFVFFCTEFERGIDNYPLILEGCDEREDALPPRHDIRIRSLGVPGSVHIQS